MNSVIMCLKRAINKSARKTKGINIRCSRCRSSRWLEIICDVVLLYFIVQKEGIEETCSGRMDPGAPQFGTGANRAAVPSRNNAHPSPQREQNKGAPEGVINLSEYPYC